MILEQPNPHHSCWLARTGSATSLSLSLSLSHTTWAELRRAGSLYGELARFVLRLLGYKPKQQEPPKDLPAGGNGTLAMPQQQQQHYPHSGPGDQPAGPSPWDRVWRS